MPRDPSGAPPTNTSSAGVKERASAPTEACGPAPVPGAWVKLTRGDAVALALTVAVVAGVTVPQLPPGVCFNDPGDIQLASATLGIMHPPGYAGFVTLGYLASRVPRADPAYMVSLACLISGLAALALCLLTQVRLGVDRWIAGASTLALVLYPRVWSNLVAPEVYMPSLAFLIGATYIMVRYTRCGVRRDLWWAAALLGFAIANRPPVLFTVPFFVIGWWIARKRCELCRRRPVTSLVVAATCVALPVFYSLGYLWVRDRPDIAYNYIDVHNAEAHVLPQATDGWRAKVQRVAWQASAAQFAGDMGNTWKGVRAKLRWLRHAVFGYLYGPPVAVALLLVGLGIALVYRRCRVSAWLLSGLAAGTVVFVCAYRVYGQAADLLPLLFTLTVVGGVVADTCLKTVTSGGVRLHAVRMRSSVAISAFGILCVTHVFGPPRRPQTAVAANALPYLAELDMATLPENAVIFSSWHHSPPLWYAQHVLTERTDIDVVNAVPDHWPAYIAAIQDRPIFVVRKAPAINGFTLTPFRNVWQIEPTGPHD